MAEREGSELDSCAVARPEMKRWQRRSFAGASAVLACGVACAIDSRSLDAPACTGEACGPDGVEAELSAAPSGPGAGSGGTIAAGSGASDAARVAADEGGGALPATSDGAGASNGAAGGAGGAGGRGAEVGGAGGAGAVSPSGGGPASVGGEGCPTNLLVNGGFEAGEEPWMSFSTGVDPLIYDFTEETYDGVDPYGGLRLGWLGGVPSEVNRLSQAVSVPAGVTSLGLQYSLRVQVFEPHPNIDFLRVRLVIAGEPTPIAEFTNADAGDDWVDFTPPPVPVAANGEPTTAVLEIESEIGAGPGTNFFVDDLALVPTCAP